MVASLHRGQFAWRPLYGGQLIATNLRGSLVHVRLQHSPHLTLTPYSIPHFKKNHVEVLVHSFQTKKKNVGTIVPMPPVKSVKKTRSNIPATLEHIWRKLF